MPCESVETGIQYSLSFEELEACNAAGLDMIRWLRDEFTIKEKTIVIAWNRMHNMVRMHSADAESRASKQKMASES